ncbi:hypothetical protein GCM10029963_66430 [Micromonospora andamanensis]
MRVLLCPDKFAGTLPAPQVAAAVADGWREVAPGDDLLVRPLADGGPGFLDVLAEALPGQRVPVPTTDPLGRPAAGEMLLTDGAAVAWLESAQACGLHLLDAAERNPLATTSYGLGLLIAAAVEAGARTVVVGLGGSATNDGGAGMLAALGAVGLDGTGAALPYGGAALAAAAKLDGLPRLREARLIAATDVDNPLLGLHGASNVFGPQKGADRADVLLLDAALGRWAEVLERDLPGCPSGLGALPGGVPPGVSVPRCSPSVVGASPASGWSVGPSGWKPCSTRSIWWSPGRGGSTTSRCAARWWPEWPARRATGAYPAWCSPVRSAPGAGRRRRSG